jgi:hypothetical protein
MNPNNLVQPLPPEGSFGYAWIPLPAPIQTNDGMACYAVLTIKVGRNSQLRQCGPGFHCRTEEEAKKLFDHLVANRPNVARFKIYRDEEAFEKQGAKEINKRKREAEVLQDFLWQLEYFTKLDDVDFGRPPSEPDFVFHLPGKQIGAELTVLDPKIFAVGGYKERGEFRKWQMATKSTPAPTKFSWGCYSLRESLAVLNVQIDEKCKKVARQRNFSERWLLLHVANGSPFSQILDGEYHTVPGREKEVNDFVAKSMHEVYLVCKKAKPFSHVMFFMQDGLLAFPTRAANLYKLPIPSEDILRRGRVASEKFLDWREENYSATKTTEAPPAIR